MAPTGEQKKSSSTASATENVKTTPTGGERRSFFSRFALPPAVRGGSSPQTARSARQQSPLGKMLFGWMILLLVIEVVSIALQYVDIKWFNLALEKPWFHTNAFLIGGMNTYFLLNLAAIIGAYYLLVHFKLMPRDLFGTRPQAATPANQPGKPAPDGLGKSRHSRAARRHTTGAHTTSQASTTRRVTAKTRTSAPPPPPPVPTGHDDEYYQVKEAQRQLRRREAKR